MAVYTEIGDDELRAFIAAYDIGEVLSCKGIAEGVENSNYLLGTERGTFILTLYEKRVAPEDLPFFIALMDHLAHQGVACPTPVRGEDGERAARAVRPAGGDRHLPQRHVAAAHRAVSLRRGRQALARLHQAGAIVRDDAAQRPQPSPAGGGSTTPAPARADEVQPGLRRRDRRGARPSRAGLAARPADRGHPCRSVSRQCVLPRPRADRADRLSISPAPISSPTTSRSASTPGASSRTAAST